MGFFDLFRKKSLTGNTHKYVCDSYPIKQRVGNSWQIDLKFEQVF